MKLTVFTFNSSLQGLNVGDVLTLKLEKSGAFNPINAYYNGAKVGTCSESEYMLLPQTSSKTELENFLVSNNKKEINATVVSTLESVKSNNNKNNPARAVEVDINNQGITGEELVYTLKMGGVVSKFLGKPSILRERKQGNDVYGYVELSAENKIIFFAKVENNGSKQLLACGSCTEVEAPSLSSLSEIDNLKNYLKIKKKADAVAKGGFTQNAFNIEVKVTANEKKVLREVSVNNILDDIIDEDEAYKKTVRDIASYLQDNRFSASQIKEIIASHCRDYPENVKNRIPKEPKIKYIDQKNVNALKLGFGAIKMGWHLLARGPKGAGKNEFSKTMAWIYQKPLYEFSCNRDVDKIDLTGGNTLEAIEEDGITKNTIKFAPEILLECMEYGGIYVADEINLAEAGVLGLLNPITDSRGTIEVPGYKKIVAKKGFCLIGTMNEGYQGTNDLNEALSDRFIHIPFEAPNTISKILKQHYPTIPDKYISMADIIYKKMLALVKGNSISSDCVTIRGFLQALPYIDIIGVENAFVSCVANKIFDEKYREYIIQTIKESIN